MNKIALITGISGQDGSYLAELLLEKGYEVHGLIRRVALENKTFRLWRIKHLLSKITLHSASMESYASIFNIIKSLQPQEVYHLAAQSYVDYSFEDEFSTFNININGTHYVLSAIKESSPKSRFYFAGSSEMFGKAKNTPQNEETPFHPRSAYGISKVAGFDLTRNYREAYDIHASSGILFNHESKRRGYEFVTRKISIAVAKIKLGMIKFVELGNLDAERDWGHAKDYVEAMWLMLQQDKPDNFVILSGDDGLTLPMIYMGAEGVISVIGQSHPKEYSTMVAEGSYGNIAKANKLHYGLYDYYGPLYSEGNPAGVKACLELLGICKAVVRPPLVEVSSTIKTQLKVLLNS